MVEQELISAATPFNASLKDMYFRLDQKMSGRSDRNLYRRHLPFTNCCENDLWTNPIYEKYVSTDGHIYKNHFDVVEKEHSLNSDTLCKQPSCWGATEE